MADGAWEPLDGPDASHLVTEDDEPVDNLLSEKNQRLLTSALYASWSGPPPREEADEDETSLDPQGRRRFLAAANVGIFVSPKMPPIVPDVFLSTDVSLERLTWAKGGTRAYFVWEMGKPPELVIEIVSNREGGELKRKRARYARAHVSHYVVFDPGGFLDGPVLRAYELRGDLLRPLDVKGDRVMLEGLGLGLALWEGAYEETNGTWLRFVDGEGQLLLTGDEKAAAESARADEATSRADEATTRADEATARADEATARLRELGIDPD